MPRTSRGPVAQWRPQQNGTFGSFNGTEISNRILTGLPRKECPQVFAVLEPVRLRLRQMLHEVGEPIRSVYFLNEGLASVLTVQPDGKSVEVGLIGKEGFVGLPAVFGFKTSALRVVTQADAVAYRLETGALRRLMATCPNLSRALQRYSMFLAMQSAQIAACNRLHEVVERLARWLLMCQDRVDLATLPITQESLAQMLGTRRSSVSVAACALQRAGIIDYSRGSVVIDDRARLEQASCACYRVMCEQVRTWEGEFV